MTSFHSQERRKINNINHKADAEQQREMMSSFNVSRSAVWFTGRQKKTQMRRCAAAQTITPNYTETLQRPARVFMR